MEADGDDDEAVEAAVEVEEDEEAAAVELEDEEAAVAEVEDEEAVAVEDEEVAGHFLLSLRSLFPSLSRRPPGTLHIRR